MFNIYKEFSSLQKVGLKKRSVYFESDNFDIEKDYSFHHKEHISKKEYC